MHATCTVGLTGPHAGPVDPRPSQAAQYPQSRDHPGSPYAIRSFPLSPMILYLFFAALPHEMGLEMAHMRSATHISRAHSQGAI